MAASSSSGAICRGFLAGAVPALQGREFRGHRDIWSWRGRVANALFDRKIEAADDVPAEVEGRSSIERALNAYSFDQARQETFLESFYQKGVAYVC